MVTSTSPREQALEREISGVIPTKSSDTTLLEGWKFRISSIPPGTGEMDVILGNKKYTIYRPDSRRIQAVVAGELITYDSVESMYDALSEKSVDNITLTPSPDGAIGEIPPETLSVSYRDSILAIPRGQGKGGVVIDGVPYTIQRKPFGEAIDVLIDKKFYTFDSIDAFLTYIGRKKEVREDSATKIEKIIPENLRNPKRGDIIEYAGKSYRYIGMGERWQIQEQGALWNQIDYVTGPYISQKEMVELFLSATVENVKSKVKNVEKNEENSDIDSLIRAFETQIQMAQDLIAAGVDNKNNELSNTDKKGIESTIEKMREQIKRLEAERKKRNESGGGGKTTPERFPLGSPTTKGELIPYDPNRGNQWKALRPKEVGEKNEDDPKVGDKKPNITPDYGFIAKSRGIRSNISDVSVNLESVAYTRAEERIRTEYADSGFFGKAKQFFTRADLLEKYRREELEKLRNESIFDAGTAHIRTNASDRFAKSNALTGTESVKEIASLEIPELNSLATQFVQGIISEAQFQEEFEELTQTNEALKKALDGIQNGGTNIMKYLHGERQFLQILRDMPNDEASIRAHLDVYIRSNPGLKKILEGALGLNLDERIEQVVFLLSKNEVREAIRSQTLTVSLSILTGGEAAFAIETGEKTNTRTYRVGKWLQKHPVLSSVGAALGITASSFAAGPIGNLIAGSLGIGGINGLRRSAEYSDEHTGFEKRITQGTHLESDIYTKVENLRNELANATGFKKRWIEFRLSRAEAKLKLYQTQGIPAKELKNGNTVEGRTGTTHRHFAPIGSLNRKLYAYITEREGFELTGEKAVKNKAYLRLWILQGLARIDLWKSSGHNFLKSQNEASMEGDYNILYENLLLAQEKIGFPLEELRASSEYKELLKALEEDYARAKKNFTSSRTSSAVKTGVIHGSIYGASSVIFQWLAGTGIFDSTKVLPGSPTVVAGGVVVDPGIADNLRRTLGQAQYEAFVTHLSTATSPETLWDTLVVDIFQNKALGNDVKNQIMTFILNATDVQNGVVKPELLIEAAKQGLFTDIANNSQNIDHVVDLLKQWGYGSIDKTWLVDTLRGIDAGTIQTSGLSPMEQTKVSEALWCYVHRDGISAGSHMWEVFMDKVSLPGKMPDSTVVEKGGEWLRYIGIPTWKNTFLSRLRTDIVDSSGKPIQQPKENDIGFDDGWKEQYGFDVEKKRFEESREKKKKDGSQEEQFRVVTRGDKKEIDSRDVNPDYPEPIIEKSQEEVINYMIDSAPAFFGDDYKYVNLWKAGKLQKDQLVWLLQLSIERQRKEFEKNMGIYEEVLESAHSLVQKVFQKYELDESRLLSYEAFRKKARFYTFYEFMANFGSMNSSGAFSIKGYNRMTSGEIAFNMHGLTQKPMQSQILYIKHVAIHELLHGTAVNNYWEAADENGGQDYVHRRSGMLQVNGKMKERGRALNEGIVETLSFSAMVSLFGEGYSSSGNIFYRDERKVIAQLVENYSIDESLFVRAAYTRDGMRDLARALEGEGRKGFLSLIIALMDRSPANTLRFLEGGKFQILEQEYSKVFPASLLENGKLGKKLREYISADASGISLKSKNEKGQISE